MGVTFADATKHASGLAPRRHAELTGHPPELAKRTIFMTVGTAASAKEVVATVTQPVLAMLFDPKDLRALILEFAR